MTYREDDMNNDMEAERPVYVPVPGSALATVVAPRSGMVGEPHSRGEKVLVYYEGNLYGAYNVVTFADRVMIAAGRASQRYPTQAFAAAEPEELCMVGAYDPLRGEVRLSDPEALAQWLGTASVEQGELLTTGGKGARRREVMEALGRKDLTPEAKKWAEEEGRRLGLL
jgi:hypothetical protein